MKVEHELPLQSRLNERMNRRSNHMMMSYLWVRLLLIAAAVKSILGLIILFLLLGVSICVLIIGFHFRHSYHCPIEHKISLFLIVAGSVSVEWIILSIILSIITIVLKRIRSFMLVVFIILTALMIIITNIFLFMWVIFGSMWTLKALNTVQYVTPHENTFCHRTLYRFTLGYLVMTYILSALQCWYRLCIVIFCSLQEQ
jgi:hypothetical protein